MSSVPWNARFAPKLMKIILGGTQALKRMKPVFSRSTEWYLRVFWATTQQQSHFCSDVPIQIWRGTGWVCRAALRGKRHWGLFSLWQENEKGFILRRQRQLGLVLISDKGFEPFQTAHADQRRKKSSPTSNVLNISKHKKDLFINLKKKKEKRKTALKRNPPSLICSWPFVGWNPCWLGAQLSAKGKWKIRIPGTAFLPQLSTGLARCFATLFGISPPFTPSYQRGFD